MTTSDPAAPGPELMVVGRIVAAQGLQGELRVLPLSDFPQRFTRPGRRWLRPRQQPARPVQLLSGRQLPGRELFVVRLEAIDSRDAAEALAGSELLVDAADRPRLAPGEFHLLDLVGLEVRLLDPAPVAGEPAQPAIGRIRDLVHAGNDLLEVELEGGGGRCLLIPFVEAIVPVVNLAQGWVGLTPPPGLLEL
jgi:16S rRNA processing protein RimM